MKHEHNYVAINTIPTEEGAKIYFECTDQKCRHMLRKFYVLEKTEELTWPERVEETYEIS